MDTSLPKELSGERLREASRNQDASPTDSRTATFALAESGLTNAQTLSTEIRQVDAEKRTAEKRTNEIITAAILQLEAQLAAERDSEELLEILLGESESLKEAIEDAKDGGQEAVQKEMELRKKILDAKVDWLKANIHSKKSEVA